MQLSVDISADGDWGFDRRGVGLLREDSDGSVSDQFDLFFVDGFEVSEVVDDNVDLCFVRHVFKQYRGSENMLSDKEIRSMIWSQFQPGEEGEQQAQEQILDLSHQQLRRLRQFQLKELEVQRVNASYNFFKDLSALNFKEFKQQADIPVRWLDVSFNFIKQIDQSAEACHILKYLRYLNISANQIQSADFSQLDLPLLQTLNMNSNRIKYFLHCPSSLKVLTMNDNQLSSLAFTGGSGLTILTAKKNSIKKIGLDLPQLLVFDIEQNRVEDIELVKELLKKSINLLSINIRDNPVSKSKEYKISVLENCMEIGRIDDVIISPHIREGFKVLKAEEQLNQMLDRVNKQYEVRLAEKQKIKQALVKKIRAQEHQIEEKYMRGIQEERQQFQLLEKQALSKLAKGKLAIPEEKGQLTPSMRAYADELELIVQQNELDQHTSKVQKQYLNEYLDYMNKKRPYSENGSADSKIRMIKGSTAVEAGNLQVLPDLQGIVLFDQQAIDPLLDQYNVKMMDF